MDIINDERTPSDQGIAEKLLRNIFTNAIYPDEPFPVDDPELDFLRSRKGFAILSGFITRVRSHPQSFQTLSYQQDLVYNVLCGALFRLLPADYAFFPCRMENQFAALIFRRDETPMEQNMIRPLLEELLTPPLHDLIAQGIPLRVLWIFQEDYTFLQRGYFVMRQSSAYYEYMEKPRRQVEQLLPPVAHMHYGLWRIMEESTDQYLDAFLQNDIQQAIDCIDQIIQQIDRWIMPSRDTFLGDIQYYFDMILEKISLQFGQDILQGVPPIYSLFSTSCINETRSISEDITRILLRNARKNTTTDTFNRLMEVKDYIQENLRDYSLSASSIADHFQISPQLLSIQFKKGFGMTPLQYIEQQRVNIIKEYLSNTDMPVHEICDLTGIGTVSTLHRMFSKNCGMSPGTYRKLMRTDSPVSELD